MQKNHSSSKQPKSQPIICGIDMGSWTVKISYYDGEKFETLVNEANFRQTPSLVAFTPLERMIGEPANIKLKSNYKNTVRSPMRHIGMGKNVHMIEQELKYSTFKHDLEDGIKYLVQHNNKNISLSPQQCLMALMSKVKEIVNINNFHLYASFIALPSYMSNGQRSTIRKCTQLQKMGQVYLIDDWVAVASEYSYFRIKDLNSMEQPERNVIFVDIGYSKFSTYAVQFTPTSCRLLDYQHLKYTGSKNMDNLLTEFYDHYFEKQPQNNGTRIISNPKALVKLRQMIEKQRKILSANIQHHLNIEYILNQSDLSYNMKRGQFQDLITPVISQMSASLNSIKNRVLHNWPIHSVQLIGGASRIPLLQQIIADALTIQPSRTMNSSESMSRGAAIYGAIQTGFLSNVVYEVDRTNFAAVSVAWNHVKGDNFKGENHKDYLNKKVVFDWGCRYPCQHVINFGPQGVVELYVYYEHEIASQSIGYLRVNTPNKVVFVFDRDKIVSAKCMVGGFLIYNFHEIREERWQKMQKAQRQFQQNDKNILSLYNIKNEYESLIYKIKDKVQNEWKSYSTKQEQQNIASEVNSSEKWISQQNEKPTKQLASLKQYTQRIDSLNGIYEIMSHRKKNYEEIQPLFRQFIEKARSNANKLETNSGKTQLRRIVKQVQDEYERMAANLFETKILTPIEIKDYMRKISRLQ